MTPALLFNSMTFDPGIPGGLGALSLEEMSLFLEEKRLALKRAVDYRWDNDNFYLCDARGVPRLSFIVSEGALHMWDVTGTQSVYNFPKSEWDSNRLGCSRLIDEALTNTEKGLSRCQECGKWVASGKKFAFAGYVCDSCFNPAVHLPPDTRGD